MFQSAVAIQQMQKDLSEFTTTIQRDTSTAVASSATVIKDSLKVSSYKFKCVQLHVADQVQAVPQQCTWHYRQTFFNFTDFTRTSFFRIFFDYFDTNKLLVQKQM